MVKIVGRTTISSRLMFVFVGFVLIILFGFVIFAYAVSHTMIDKMYEEKINALTLALGSSVGEDDLRDHQRLQNVVNKYTYNDSEILDLGIYLLNDKGELSKVASSDLSTIGGLADENNIDVFKNGEVFKEEVFNNKVIPDIRVVFPIRVGGYRVGTYDFRVSMVESASLYGNRIVLFLLLIGLLIFVGVLVLGLLIGKWFVKPLRNLMNEVKKVGGGQKKSVELSSEDELGDLARVFNQTALELEKFRGGLEKKVNEKTVELSSKVVEMDRMNTALRENSKAVLNILDDTVELQEKLRVEKASIEGVVVERTKELKDEEARLRAAINAVGMGVMMTDMSGKPLMINSELSVILGQPKGGWTMDELNRLVPSIDLKKSFEESVNGDKDVDIGEINIGNKFLSIGIYPIYMSGRPIGRLILVRDITERKVAERSKEEFFSIASHELRTPLTAIRGNAALIKQMYWDKLPDTNVKEMMEDIHSASVRLIEIVNDFLDTSRLEQGRMVFKIEKMDFGKVVTECVMEVDDLAKQKGLEISGYVDDEYVVMGDVDKAKQVVVNLLSNAIKFTDTGSVKWRVVLDGEYSRFEVSDSGRGISLENQAFLFRKFQQAGESLYTRDTIKGTGLGLYISRLIANGMNGKIGLVRSEKGKGSTFAFCLPLAKDG